MLSMFLNSGFALMRPRNDTWPQSGFWIEVIPARQTAIIFTAALLIEGVVDRDV
jgi:hypothetical protein